MSKHELGPTCEDCIMYDGMCKNQESDHYQHVIGMMHPACDEVEHGDHNF